MTNFKVGDRVKVSRDCIANYDGVEAEDTISSISPSSVRFLSLERSCNNPARHLTLIKPASEAFRETPWVICESFDYPHTPEGCATSRNHKKLYVQHDHDYVTICKECGDSKKECLGRGRRTMTEKLVDITADFLSEINKMSEEDRDIAAQEVLLYLLKSGLETVGQMVDQAEKAHGSLSVAEKHIRAYVGGTLRAANDIKRAMDG